MKIVTLSAEVLKFEEIQGLDPVTAVLMDYGNGQGKIIIECFGDCFSAYWGSMGMPLRQFIASCGTDYLEGNFIGRLHKLGKPQKAYLRRIIDAVKEGLR